MFSSKKKNKKKKKAQTNHLPWNHWDLEVAGVSIRQKDKKKKKNLTMLCTMHILRGNRVTKVLLVKLFTYQIRSNHPFFYAII